MHKKYSYLLHWILNGQKYVKINSVNPLCLNISKINGYIEGSNGNKYWTLVSTDKYKVTLKIYEDLYPKWKILLDQKLITQKISVKNTRKSNSFQMMICL